MSDHQTSFESLSELFTPIHRDGHKFLVVSALITLLMFFLWSPLGWIAAIATACIAYFFRDPDRVTPLREGLIIAPADGKITHIEKVTPPEELALGDDERIRISTCLTLFDVHVNRSPVAGRITRSVYVPGAFVNANTDKASEENERRALVIETANGDNVAVVQIAGLITRRIITFAHDGDSVGVGQRFGLIRFGSRVDVYLPPGKSALVAVGQQMVAGETILADLNSNEPERESRRS